MSEVPMTTAPAPPRSNPIARILRWALLLAALVLLVAWATGRARPITRSTPAVDITTVRGAPLLSTTPRDPLGSELPAAEASRQTSRPSSARQAPQQADSTNGLPVPAGAGGAVTGSSGVIAPDGRLLPALPFGLSDAPPPPPPQDGYKSIGFAFLSDYEYQLYDRIEEEEGEELPQQIPPTVAAYDREQIAVAGFMIPIEMENRQVRSFLLVKSQLLCCFGIPPRMNEWIYCEMRLGKQAEYTQDLPVIVAGELHVGEELQDGYVMSIYRMYVDKVLHTGGY